MQSVANKSPAATQSRIPQILLDRFESEWRAMRTTKEAPEKLVPPSE